jgi:prepilin peptidase CpaA
MLALLTYHVSTLLLLAIVMAASWIDFSDHRIPNWLSLGGAFIALMLHTWFLGLSGLLAGVGGLVTGLAIFLPFYIRGGMGAGDVKLMAAAGAFFGWPDALLAAGMSLGAGAVIGGGILVARGGLGVMLSRYYSTLHCLLSTGQLVYIPAGATEPARTRFPYAIAIATGTTAALWWRDELNYHEFHNAILALFGAA